MRNFVKKYQELLTILLLIGGTVLFVSLLPSSPAYSQGQYNFPSTDPCLSPNVAKSSVSVNIATAATTQLIPLVAGQTIYICGGYLSVASSATAAATVQFEYGTGVTCGTGTTVLTGTVGTGTATAGIDAEPFPITSSGTSLTAPSGNALCAVTAGTTVNIQGFLVYTQR